MKKRLVVGTRTSKLAMWQTRRVIELLTEACPGLVCDTRPFETRGDKTLDKPLPEIGGKGLFTQELEEALLAGRIDAAVHSLKDPIPGRANAGDCVVARNGWTLATLPRGAVVGTSSVRRQAQLLALRPDLDIRSIRGNVETRIRKVTEGQYDATILARAGVERLGLTEHVTEWLGTDIVLPAPGQGALAVQCRADDAETLELMDRIDEAKVRAAVTSERMFLEGLGGGCSAPVGAFARTNEQAPPWKLKLSVVVGAPDGSRMIRLEDEGNDPVTLGKTLANAAIAEGAGAFLQEPGATRHVPLQGKRVVVTRSREQAGEFCAKLTDLGAKPIVVPTIRIVPIEDDAKLDTVLSAFSTYDWAVFTSVNGARIFCDCLEARGLETSIFEGVKVAAVGTKTAEVLSANGIKSDFVPDVFVGEEIAMGLDNVSGKRVCLLRAEVAGADLVKILESRGARVDDVGIYRTVPVAVDSEAVREFERGVDIVAVTSGSTVRNFASALKADETLESLLHGMRFACIGPVTAAAARELGLDVAVVAKVHTVDGLADALVEYFEEDKGK
jgi:hydroxymethylbilane synthase